MGSFPVVTATSHITHVVLSRQQRRRNVTCIPVEKCVSECVEFAEGLLWVDNQGITRNHSFLVPVHHRDKRVRGRLGANPHPREVLLHEVPNECGLPGGILTHQENHGLVVEVGIFERRGVEIMESIRVL